MIRLACYTMESRQDRRKGKQMNNDFEIVIITGMSGAGKTVAVQSFEDLGYFCVDNMPPKLIPTFIKLAKTDGSIEKIALVVDLRSREFFNDLQEIIQKDIKNIGVTPYILFLQASDEKLVSRYKESRRSHPISTGGVLEGIQKERELLNQVKENASLIIDTSQSKSKDLKKEINERFNTSQVVTFQIEVMSFGFKHEPPIDADIVMDVRFLPNPYYIDELRPLTGLDETVYDYVMEQPETEIFYQKFISLLDFLLPGYKHEGKNNLTVAIGCTGGQHRSVALTERISEHIASEGYSVRVTHRDKDK